MRTDWVRHMKWVRKRERKKTQVVPTHAPLVVSARNAYDAYIASEDWAARRNAYFATHERICAACKTQTRIHLHHMTYEHLRHEPDDDLIALCEDCHQKVHAAHAKVRIQRTLREVTMWFVSS